MIEAAAIPETFFTVWTNVFDKGAPAARRDASGTWRVERNWHDRDHAGQGLRRAVVVTAGSVKNAQCMGLGADRAINYRTQDFVAEVKARAIAPDVILDMVGGDYVARNIACVAKFGRIVNIAFQKGSKVEVDLLPMMLKRLTLTGSTLRPRTVAEKAEIARALEDKVWPLLAAGKIKPVIYRTFPLADAAGAHRLMEMGEHVGKIVSPFKTRCIWRRAFI